MYDARIAFHTSTFNEILTSGIKLYYTLFYLQSHTIYIKVLKHFYQDNFYDYKNKITESGIRSAVLKIVNYV